MEPSYLFYDIETTGLNKCFDQVLQFAAIRTDVNLHELERHEIFIKLRPSVIPSPQAVITHRIGINKMQEGENEVSAIQKIHALFNTPGTITVGYNTLNFDDEFLRFSFYRNLLPPYTHQYANQCRRMDIYPITIMYYLYKNNAIIWGLRNGRASLKLEDISAANEFAFGNAHNAMVDVEATLALACKLKQHQDMWDYVSGYFHKSTDLARQKKLPFSLKLPTSEHQEALMITGKIGYENAFQAPVIYLGQHYHYRNQTLWLRLDQEKLQQITPQSIAEHTTVIRKKTSENQILLPPNKRFLESLPLARRIITDKNRIWLKENPEIFKKISQHHLDYKYPIVPNLDISTALYDLDFPPPYEEKLYAEFHKAPPQSKENIALKFADPTRQELAMRLIAENYPQYLSPENKKFYDQYIKQCCSDDNQPVDFKNDFRLSPKKALDEIVSLKQNKSLDEEQMSLLTELQDYLAFR